MMCWLARVASGVVRSLALAGAAFYGADVTEVMRATRGRREADPVQDPVSSYARSGIAAIEAYLGAGRTRPPRTMH